MASLVVFFATGRVPLRANWRKLLFPNFAIYAIISEVIHLLTWSNLAHVAIADDRHVLSPAASGNRVWPIDRFLGKYPGLTHAYVVPVLNPITAKTYRNRRRMKLALWLFKWLSGGRVRTDDCVCVVRRVLADAGVDTPDSCYTPARLSAWLDRRYERAEMG